MSQSITIELEMPGDLKRFRLPKSVNRRLQDLLDKQSRDGKLSVGAKRRGSWTSRRC